MSFAGRQVQLMKNEIGSVQLLKPTQTSIIYYEQTNVVYYAKPVGDVFEIFRGETKDDGKTWIETTLTTKSNKDNVRPFAIRGGVEECSTQVMWMRNKQYSTYKKYKSQIKMDFKK